MGHSEVAQAPGHGGDDGDNAAVGHSRIGGGVIHAGHRDVAGQGGGIGADGVKSAGVGDAEADNDDQGDGHDNRLHQVGGGGSQESAGGGVDHDDDGGDNHSCRVVKPEQRGEQLAAGGEAGGGVGNEEDHDDQGGDGHEQVALVPEAALEEVGDGVCLHVSGVGAQALGYQQPVQVGADAQTQSGPEGVADTAEIGHAGQTHQQPGGHIRGLGAHGGDQGTQLTAAQVEVADGLVGLGETETKVQHKEQIQYDGYDDTDSRLCRHNANPLFQFQNTGILTC